jgi:hypothetical protein
MAAMAYESFDNLRDLIARLEAGEDEYAFYGVMLYAPANGLDGQLHEYVTGHWTYLHHLTGETTLLMALERLDYDRPLESFKPEEIYDIARYLGVDADQLPALAIFTAPGLREDIRVLRIRDFLAPGPALTDEEITEFFRSLVTAIDCCAGMPADRRLTCLDEGLKKHWPDRSASKGRVFAADAVVTPSVSRGGSVLVALQQVIAIFNT